MKLPDRSAVTLAVCRSLACGLALVLVSGCNTEPVNAQPGTTTTLILVRHAERDSGADPPLNAEGQVRAQALKDALSENGVTAIYCTDLLRNRQTVQPLADELDLTPRLVTPLVYADIPGASDQIVNEILRDHAGGTVLFCGNIGSVFGTPGITEGIYRRLGGTGRPPGRYQDLYIVVVPDEGAARFIKTTYGGPSSLD